MCVYISISIIHKKSIYWRLFELHAGIRMWASSDIHVICLLEKSGNRVILQSDLGKLRQASQALNVYQDVLCWPQKAVFNLSCQSVKVRVLKVHRPHAFHGLQ